jgi:hypothetical protein
MEQVALSLQMTAIGCRNARDFDDFGRSAFNRYYYALFLTVRELLSQFDPKWKDLPHASIPPLLLGQVLNGLKRRRKRSIRLGDSRGTELANQAIAAVRELESTMRRGYIVRVMADYNPAIPVTKGTADRFSLGDTDITDAHEWPNIARRLSPLISRAWRLPE